MSTNEPELSEEELRAAYEEEIRRIRVEHVLLENVVTLINLGMRRTGLIEGTEIERDPVQVQIAIESVRSLMGVLEQIAGDEIESIKQALSQLQMAFVQMGGATGAPAGAPVDESATGAVPPQGVQGTQSGDPSTGPGPAQRSGRLWIPGQ